MTDTERYTRDAEQDAVRGVDWWVIWASDPVERKARAIFKRELRAWIKARRDKRTKATKGGQHG